MVALPRAQSRLGFLVPFVEEDDYYFLKTIIPSRKATRKYLGHGDPEDKA